MRTATRPAVRHPEPAADPAPDDALDDALDRIAALTARLHAVSDLHAPRRTLLGGHVCRACSRPAPCPTERASRGAA